MSRQERRRFEREAKKRTPKIEEFDELIRLCSLNDDFISVYVGGWKKEHTRNFISIPNMGVLLYHKLDYDPHNNHSTLYHIDYIYVLPQHRRAHVGSTLLRHLADIGHAGGFIEDSLVPFYERNGFVCLNRMLGLTYVQTIK